MTARDDADLAGVGPAASASELPDGFEYVAVLGALRVYRPRVDAVAPPRGLSAAALTRRRFAERIADVWGLVAPPERGRLKRDFVDAHSMYAPASAAPVVGEVIATAPGLLDAAINNADVRLYADGPGGFVLLLHGPGWSLVMDYSSVGTLLRICTDRLGEWAIAADEERDPRVIAELEMLVNDLIDTLRAHSIVQTPWRELPAD